MEAISSSVGRGGRNSAEDVKVVQRLLSKIVTEINLTDDGRPKILFEAHHFAKKTDHQYNDIFPDISSRSWNRKLYSNPTGEYVRLMKAMALNRDAALQSASWGTFPNGPLLRPL